MGFFSKPKYRSPVNSANLSRAQSNQQRRQSIMNVDHKLVEYKNKKEPHLYAIRNLQGELDRLKTEYDGMRQQLESKIAQEQSSIRSINMHMNQLRQRRMAYQKNLKRRSRH